MTTDKQKYRFCMTNDNETMELVETSEWDTTSKRTIICLRNKNTGMVCSQSPYSVPYREGTTSAYEFDDDTGKITKFTRRTVSLKSSDSDVTRGIKLIIDANRSTDDDWEVVKFTNVNKDANHPLLWSPDTGEAVDDGYVNIPYIDGYCGHGKYKTYDCSLYDIPRDILALFKDEEVIESNDWTDGTDMTDSYRAMDVPNLEVI